MFTCPRYLTNLGVAIRVFFPAHCQQPRFRAPSFQRSDTPCVDRAPIIPHLLTPRFWIWLWAMQIQPSRHADSNFACCDWAENSKYGKHRKPHGCAPLQPKKVVSQNTHADLVHCILQAFSQFTCNYWRFWEPPCYSGEPKSVICRIRLTSSVHCVSIHVNKHAYKRICSFRGMPILKF